MTKRKGQTILLYNPRIVDDKEMPDTVFVPPLPLLAISSPVLQEGYDVRILDGNFFDDKGLEDIPSQDILCVCVTGMTGYQIKDGLDFARRVRALDPNIPIIWGGVHVSLLPEQSVEHELVDIVVSGQGEETFLETVKTLSEGGDLGTVAGIFFKENGEVIKNPDRPLVDIRQYAMLPYDLLDMERYFRESKVKNFRISGAFDSSKDRFLYYYSSVGCPFACRFCASSKHSKRKWIGFSVERVLDEVEYLIKTYQVTFLQMVDAEFFIDIKRAVAIAQGFLDRGFDLKWKAQIRADSLARMTHEQLQIIKKSGYVHAEVGVESGSERLLRYIDKKITVEQVLQGAQLLKDNDILASFIFLFGLPGETKKDIKASFRVATDIKRIMPEALLPIYFFNPYPGVPVFDDAVKMGMTAPDSLQAWGDISFEMKLSCQLVPWLNDRYVDYCHKVVIFYLPLAFPADIQFGTITHMTARLKDKRLGWKWRVLHRCARWRAERQFFALPWEWALFKYYLKLTGQRSW